jgi:predicted transcriptional regulator
MTAASSTVEVAYILEGAIGFGGALKFEVPLGIACKICERPLCAKGGHSKLTSLFSLLNLQFN